MSLVLFLEVCFKVHVFQKHTKVVDQARMRVGIFKIMG